MDRLTMMLSKWVLQDIYHALLAWHVAQMQSKMEGRLLEEDAAKEGIFAIKLREARKEGGMNYVKAIFSRWSISKHLRYIRDWRANQRDEIITKKLTEVHTSSMQVSQLINERRGAGVSRLWKATNPNPNPNPNPNFDRCLTSMEGA